MRYDDIDPGLRAFVGAWLAYRKLGFSADNIFLEVCKSPGLPADKLMLFCTLKAQHRVFRVGVATWDEDKLPELEEKWTAVCRSLNEDGIREEDLERIWQESIPAQDKTAFVLTMQSRGFQFPRSKVKNPFAEHVH